MLTCDVPQRIAPPRRVRPHSLSEMDRAIERWEASASRRVGRSRRFPSAGSGQTGFTPAQIPGAGWWRADLGWTASTGAWNDQSGNGNNLVASTNKPVQNSSGPNGTASIGYTASSSMFHKSTFTLAQTYWLWLVCEWTDAYSSNTYMADGASLNHGALLRYQTDGIEAYAGSGLVRGLPAGSATNFHAYLIKFAGTSSAVNLDDSAGTTGNAGTNAAGGITLAAEGAGVGGFANANICEVAIFTTDPGFGATTSLSLYRQQRYGF